MIEFYQKALSTGYCQLTPVQSMALLVPLLIIFYGISFLVIKIYQKYL